MTARAALPDLDTLNPAAVRAFIRTTYEAYRRRFGRHFGRLVPGIFTDEPNYYTGGGNPKDVPFEHSIPWTGRLCAVFKQRCPRVISQIERMEP